MRTRHVALAAALLLAAGCSSGTTTNGGEVDGGRTIPRLSTNEAEEGSSVKTPAKGFVWEVSEGNPQSLAEARTVAAATALAEDATKALLARLPAVGAEAGDKQDFALRPASTPPPRTGETVQGTFPPPVPPTGAAPTPKDQPLTVLRYQPEGDVPMAPRISVTFSNPMVALTSHAELAKLEVPVKVTPEIAGHWRWVGTQTLFFEPDGRAPMATDYTVEIPAGVKDALGNALATGTTFKFSTPPPRVLSTRPGGSGVELSPVFYMLFDQRVDEQAILAATKVSAGGKDVAVRPLTAEERAKLLEHGENADIAGRWVAFKAKAELPKDTHVSVTVGVGTPSAEGPRVTTEAQSFNFETYGPFVVKEHRCGWGKHCRPMQPWSIRFSNGIDEDALAPEMIQVSPAIPGFAVDVYGNSLTLRGLTQGNTTYAVTLSKDLTDVYGQKLGAVAPLKFEVGPSDKVMGAPDQGFVVLDPSAKRPRLSIYTLNYDEVDVALYKVQPKDWQAFNAYQRERRRKDGPKEPPGEKVFSKRVPTGAAEEVLNELPIDLTPGLDGQLGQVILVVKPVGAEDQWHEDSHTVIAWAEATQIGLDAYVDGDTLVAWATALKDGTPIAGAKVTLQPEGTSATTDATGIARIPLPDRARGRQMLLAEKDGDLAFLPDDSSYWSDSGSWQKRTDSDEARWFVFDDRKMYRPDETVSVKGFVRLVTPGVKGDVGALPAGALTTVRWTVQGPRGNELGKGEAQVDRFGGFDLQWKIPKTPNLGYASIRFETDLTGAYRGRSYSHSFQIQEFRRPEFEVTTRASQGPHLIGGSATMTVKAAYFAGGPLPGADVGWSVSSMGSSYNPPNHPEWVFGTWVPWWEFRSGDDMRSYRSFDGRTDAGGEHTIKLDFSEVDPPRPVTLSGEATVIDVNRQAWSASSSILVHPAAHYVGLKSEKSFYQPGEDVEISAIVTNIDGEVLKGSKIALEMVRLAWKKSKKHDWFQEEVEPQTCELTSAADPVACKLKPKTGGTHRVRATITDGEGRKNQTTLTVWVAGGKVPQSSKLEQETVQLIPAKRDYQPGETAEILVQSPFFPADGVARIVRSDHAQVIPFHLDGPTFTLKIPVEEWMIPGFTVNVNVNGSAERLDADGNPKADLPRRPAYAVGSISLRVPPKLRTLGVAVTPAAPKTEPGAKTSVAVVVTGPDGQPVSDAAVAVVAVDEAVLALTGYRVPSPVDVFYTSRGDRTSATLLRSRLVLASLDDLLAQADRDQDGITDDAMRMEEAEGAAGGEMPAPSAAPRMKMAAEPMAPGEKNGGDAPIAVRKNFDPLAVFAPTVVTDADGRAVVPVALPDNLTRYRIFAVAVAGEKSFGSAESTVTARLPLMVRMSPPRFLNFGDRFELPVVIQNQTDGPLDVDVVVKATNATLTAGQGRRVTVPANDRVEVRFPAAAEQAGTARFQAGASSGAWADAAEVKLPVWTPATTEAFATYGVIDKGAIAQPVKTPGEVWTQFGGLEVTTSSTQLQALTDAVLYLQAYPFECAEQVSSRMLSVAALKDVLGAFQANELPSPDEMLAAFARDMKKLQGMQNGDGGWGFWQRGRPSWPFLTVHVTHALARAKEKGFDVPEDMLSEAVTYLQTIENRFPPEYGPEIRRAIRAYALYVLDRLGKTDAKKAWQIADEAGGLEKLGLETVGWLYPTFSGSQYKADLEEIRRLINNAVREEAGTAHFTTSYSDGAYLLLHSNRRVDGILLEGLIKDQPDSDLIPKVVRGLLAHRTKGRWANTQESAWVLVALDKYFNTYEKVTPNFVARVWLGDDFAGEHAFKGRTTEQHLIEVPMAWLAKKSEAQSLVVAKNGAGRLYYRLGMKYAPKSLKLDPADYGFTVERVYKAVDDPADVKKNDDGSWTIKAGALVEVTLTMFTKDRRYHVALVDPMPAGLEALNPAIKGTANVAAKKQAAASGQDRWWWWGPWYEHQNLRDERAEAFTSLLWDGVYTYSYVARATTPGQFVVPPPKAEEMYHPETFGRGQTDFVTVE
ncbi:MAG: hypothetical protein EP329_19450 [Deltaproteobacteria bacterium]|nr:MAG: hypothetical protein EP329_19450 [Deltaproteobacteria bacterium]